MAALRFAILAAAAAAARAASTGSGGGVSPVQKVVELLEECKAKVQRDLDAEGKAMEEYSMFCDENLRQKGYDITTADRTIADLGADVEDANARIAEESDSITTLGQELSGKDRELAAATKDRETKHGIFVEAEREMVKSVEELDRAASTLKAQASLVQVDVLGRPLPKQGLSKALSQRAALLTAAVERIVRAQELDSGSRQKLQSFLQAAQQAVQQVQKAAAEPEDAGDDMDDDPRALAKSRAMSHQKAALVQSAQQPQVKAFETHTNGIVGTIEEMQSKAEATVSDLRKKEMNEAHNYDMLAQNLNDEIEHGKGKLSQAQLNKGVAQQELGEAKGNLVETEKSKASDEQYSATLKSECEAKAAEWSERQKAAREEMMAISKAKEILESGVKAFVQVGADVRRRAARGDEDDAVAASRRQQLMGVVRRIVQESAVGGRGSSYALAQIASSAASDPFIKVRGLVEDMIAKLVSEAQEDATHEAFCDEELSKSKQSQDEKQAKVEKLQNRIDGAESASAQLADASKTLQEEIAEIDRAQKEATDQRTAEHDEYVKASTDFRDSAQAVARAMEVLKGFYQGASLAQVASRTGQPKFGAARSDAGHVIISVLEMSEEDFTNLLAECEAQEDEAARAYKKLTNENAVARVAKEAEVKAKASEVTSIRSQLANYKQDHEGTTKELDAVVMYIDKLKPECESKAMSYKERKEAREAEIDGLKEALNILSGDGLALVQRQARLRGAMEHASM